MKSDTKILHLNVKGEYFHEVRAGVKKKEYRLYNNYWINRLVNREYDEIHYKLGYPSSDDSLRIMVFKYAGYEIETILHQHFGDKPVRVFAIKLKQERKGTKD